MMIILTQHVSFMSFVSFIFTHNVTYTVNLHCRFVLFKRHYDKYIALSEKYEESRGIAYYLEERYHEVKVGIYNAY